MSDLSSIEKYKLEKFLKMQDGYILGFSNRTFQGFILENTNIDIDDAKYSDGGTSKANRLRSFWKQESNSTVGKLTLALLDYWKSWQVIDDVKITQSEQILFDECFQISQRLIQNGPREDEDKISIDVHFEQNQSRIIEKLELAKFTIWVAVAWFTNKVLFDQLVNKQKLGINVQLIIVDDEINRNSGLNYESEFETYRYPKTGYAENIMHNKFCVIDLKTVIHGSYNWTKKANYNLETIEITDNYKNAETFAAQFIELKRKLNSK